MLFLSVPTTLFVSKSIYAKMLRKETIFSPAFEIRSGVPENLPAEIRPTLLIGDAGYVQVPSMVKT